MFFFFKVLTADKINGFKNALFGYDAAICKVTSK